MLITLSRLYANGAHARRVVDELKAAGLPEDDIGIVAPSRDRDAVVEHGAALGGAAGLLAGLGAFILPGIGAVVATGWVASALGGVIGGSVGGVVGALVESGVSENEAGRIADGVKRGGTLITVRVTAQDHAFYSDILDMRNLPPLRGALARMPAPHSVLGQAVKH